MEKTELQQKKITGLEDDLKTARTQINALATQIQMHQVLFAFSDRVIVRHVHSQSATANVQQAKTSTATVPAKTTGTSV